MRPGYRGEEALENSQQHRTFVTCRRRAPCGWLRRVGRATAPTVPPGIAHTSAGAESASIAGDNAVQKSIVARARS
jgi:hypothetical protein